MGRTSKPGLEYFKTDVDFFVNDKVRELFDEFGAEGVYIWLCLVAKGYDKWGYFIDYGENNQKGLRLFAIDIRRPVTLIKEVIQGCLRCELFDQFVFELSGVLTSDKMQEQYVFATSERRKKGSVVEMNEEWLLIKIPEKIPVNLVIIPGKKSIPPENNLIPPGRNANSIVKESKEKVKGLSGDDARPPVDNPEDLPEKNSGKKKAAPGKKQVDDPETEPFWQLLVKTWFDFNIEKFKVDPTPSQPEGNSGKPSFERDDPKILKRIIDRLKKRAADANVIWDEISGPVRLKGFLQQGFTDDWLCRNFLLSNLEKQFDTIVLNQKHGSHTNRESPEPVRTGKSAGAYEAVESLRQDLQTGRL